MAAYNPDPISPYTLASTNSERTRSQTPAYTEIEFGNPTAVDLFVSANTRLRQPSTDSQANQFSKYSLSSRRSSTTLAPYLAGEGSTTPMTSNSLPVRLSPPAPLSVSRRITVHGTPATNDYAQIIHEFPPVPPAPLTANNVGERRKGHTASVSWPDDSGRDADAMAGSLGQNEDCGLATARPTKALFIRKARRFENLDEVSPIETRDDFSPPFESSRTDRSRKSSQSAKGRRSLRLTIPDPPGTPPPAPPPLVRGAHCVTSNVQPQPPCNEQSVDAGRWVSAEEEKARLYNEACRTAFRVQTQAHPPCNPSVRSAMDAMRCRSNDTRNLRRALGSTRAEQTAPPPLYEPSSTVQNSSKENYDLIARRCNFPAYESAVIEETERQHDQQLDVFFVAASVLVSVVTGLTTKASELLQPRSTPLSSILTADIFQSLSNDSQSALAAAIASRGQSPQSHAPFSSVLINVLCFVALALSLSTLLLVSFAKSRRSDIPRRNLDSLYTHALDREFKIDEEKDARLPAITGILYSLLHISILSALAITVAFAYELHLLVFLPTAITVSALLCMCLMTGNSAYLTASTVNLSRAAFAVAATMPRVREPGIFLPGEDQLPRSAHMRRSSRGVSEV